MPRTQESLQYFLRVHLRVQGVDMKKHLKLLHVRPHVLLHLLYALIQSKHEVFNGKGSAEKLKRRMQIAINREYPETEAHLPLEKRNSHLPACIAALIDECDVPSRAVLPEKNATPGVGSSSVDSVFDQSRPTAVILERSAAAASDPASQREGAVMRHGDLHVRTGFNPLRQWHSKYFSHVLPFVIPRMVSGPDFDAEERWRRIPGAPWVSPIDFANPL